MTFFDTIQQVILLGWHPIVLVVMYQGHHHESKARLSSDKKQGKMKRNGGVA
jgi:hypothetical protein